jgi:hypothetical protein
MEKNMSSLQPRTLSNSEFIRYCAIDLDHKGLSIDWQVELLRRFTALAHTDEFPPKDERQLDLFLNL